MSVCVEIVKVKRKYTKKEKPCEGTLVVAPLVVESEASVLPIAEDMTTENAASVIARPMPVTIDNRIMYDLKELYAFDKAYFYGCSRNRKIIEKRNLSPDDYMFAYQKKGLWIVCSEQYNKCKLMLSEKWVIANVRKMMTNFPDDGDGAIHEAPPLLFLNDDEKFKDKNGTVLEIEVRGERTHKMCYFKVKDVSITLEMPNLQKVVTSDDVSYIRDIDYKCFICSVGRNNLSETTRKQLYLTYEGMIKLLYISRNDNAKYFRSWATEKLFTIQMGEREQKLELSAGLLGVNVRTIKDVFHANTSKTPCVYLYYIDDAKEIFPDNPNYRDGDLLCKFGCTEDMARRTTEHGKMFLKEFNKDIELLSFSIIESQYIFTAETNIRQYFKSNIIEYKSMTELIVINKKDLGSIKQHYNMIQNSYIGRYEEMHHQIAELREKLREKDIQIIEKDNQLKLKDKDFEILIVRHDSQLKDRDIEVLQYKVNMMEKSYMST